MRDVQQTSGEDDVMSLPCHELVNDRHDFVIIREAALCHLMKTKRRDAISSIQSTTHSRMAGNKTCVLRSMRQCK